MFDRTIRCSIWESEPFLDLPSDTHRLAFIRLVNDADDFGNLEAGAGRMCRIFSSALMVKGERGALSILSALADADLIRLYQAEGRDYAHIPRFRNDRRYTSRKHPKSPWCGDAQTTLQRKQSCGLQAKSAADLRQICSRPAGELRQDIPENSPSNTRAVPEQCERSANVVRTQDEFPMFWSAYPKKVGKVAAQKAWKNITPKRGLADKVLEALAWQKESPDWTRDDGRYIPNPATYLNQGRWQDEKPRDWIQDFMEVGDEA